MDLSPEKIPLGFGADPDKVMDPGFFSLSLGLQYRNVFLHFH